MKNDLENIIRLLVEINYLIYIIYYFFGAHNVYYVK